MSVVYLPSRFISETIERAVHLSSVLNVYTKSYRASLILIRTGEIQRNLNRTSSVLSSLFVTDNI